MSSISMVVPTLRLICKCIQSEIRNCFSKKGFVNNYDISDDDPEEVSLIIIQIARLFELFHIHLVDLVYIFANLSSEALGKLGVKGPDVGGSCGGIVGISGVMFGEIAH